MKIYILGLFYIYFNNNMNLSDWNILKCIKLKNLKKVEH